MNKFFAKLAGALSLVALVAGAGVALASGVNAKGVKATDVVDTLTAADLAATSTTYTNFSGVSKTSSAVYAGNSAKSSAGAIQMRSKNSNSGIVSTTSGGTVKSVKITVESGSNTVDIYGSNTAYTAASDLYGTSKGTKVGSTSSTKTIDVSGSYSYVGIRSNNGAIYLTSVEITWDNGEDPGEPAISLDKSNLSFYTGGDDQTVTVTPNEHFSATPTISVDGTPSYVNVSVSGTTLTVTPKAIGSESIIINAVHNTEQASATLNVEVKDSHGHVADDPFSVAEVTALIDADTSKTHEGVYVAGIVSQVDSYNSTYHSITYWISDNGSTTGQFQCYSGKGIGSADFSAVTDVEVGAQVEVCGNAKYYGTTHELDKNNYLISYEGPTSSPLSSITLDTTSVKKTFDTGDTFEYTGLVVTAHYEDESSRPVSPTSVSTPDMSSAGEKTVTVSYTENEVTKTADYSITVNAVVLHTISFNPGSGSGTMDSVQVKDGSSYDLPACEFTAPEGEVFDAWEYIGTRMNHIESVDQDYEFTALWKEATEVTDTLNNGNTIKKTQTTYESWTTEAMTSGAIYAGQSAGDKNTIQLRSNNSNSGVVSSTSGGDLISVTINFNSDTAATRTVSVYGKTSAYSNPTELYNDSTKGTLLGEANIDSGASQTITVEGSYQYIGIRSKSGALYLDSIDIVWNSSVTPPEPKVLESISVSGAKTDFKVGEDFVTTGLVVTAHYDDSSSSVITTGYDVDSSAVNKDAAGTYNVVVSYEGKSDNYNVTYTIPVVATYKKVESNLADFSGDYLIVYEEGLVAFDGSLTTLDATSNNVSVSITNDIIELSEDYEFHIAAKEGGYSIQSSSGYYIGKTADSNGLNSDTTDKYTNSISFVSGEISVVGEGGPHLRFNKTSGQDRFRFFASGSYTGQQPIALYEKVVDAGEVLMLDLLNTTSEACAAEGEHSKADFETAWGALKTAYNAISDETVLNKLATTDGNAKGTMFYEALARYDLLVGKYGLDNFISGRVVSSLGNTSVISNGSVDSNSAMIIITVIALTSISSIAVLLVIKRRKAIR